MLQCSLAQVELPPPPPAPRSMLCRRNESPSLSIKLSATGRLLDITYMCYEYRTPLFPGQLLQARQSDLSVTSIPQSVNRWRHNEYSWCSHPLHFVQASNTPAVKVRLVVWRSDLTGQGVRNWLPRQSCWCPGFEPYWSGVGFSDKYPCFPLLNVTRRSR